MKILLLSTFELQGGAAIACKRLLQAFEKQGISAKMLVRDKQTDDERVCSIYEKQPKWFGKFRFLRERLVIWLNNGFSRHNLFAVSIANTGYRIDRHPLVKWADVIHLHWVNQGFLSLKSIAKLSSLGKPVVWTMHDQWAYTGICHYTGGCLKYYTQCQACAKLKHACKKDLSRCIFKKKAEIYRSGKITFLGCSQWIAEEARKSALCHESRICSIPNAIDCTVYGKKNKAEVRQSLHLPTDKKLLLFGACKVTDDRKGFNYLKEACEYLSRREKISKDELLIVVFGGNSEEIAALLPYPVYHVGYIRDAEKMIDLYNAVDLFVIPSMEDNLPNTIMEAMACGIPCVGFDVGGIPEMIDHRQNGYVAEYKNADDLANGIHWILEEADPEILSTNARKKVEQSYSEEIVAKQHITLYHSLLS